MKRHPKEKVLRTPTLLNLSKTWFLWCFLSSGGTNYGREECLLCGFGFSFANSYLLCCFWYWRKGVEMSGGKGREWMRFWDKDFDRWKLVGQDFGSYFISNSRWGPLLCGII